MLFQNRRLAILSFLEHNDSATKQRFFLFPLCAAGKFQDCLLGIPYGLCPRSVYDKGGSVFIARRQSLHEGKEMFRLTGTKIFIPRFQCV